MLLPVETRILWLWLSLICSPGSRGTELLLEYFEGSVEKIYEADAKTYAEIPKLGKPLCEKLCDKSLAAANEVNALCLNEGIGILTPDSVLYPARLARISNKPLVLYYKGVLKELEPEVCIAEVGTREMTEYGSHAAYSIAYDLAKAGAVVVSGMAKGVDGMAHRGALDAGGYTVAVLGCGIDRAYPSEHLPLMQEIIKSGVVLTEFKPFTPPNGWNFPLRNRIISGLSQGTVVVEAPKSSGALITASTAVNQGRDIFAVPGKVGEMNSSGTNELIKNGAKIITSAADILLEYQPLYGNKINLNNIPSIKSVRFRSPLDLKVASPAPRFVGGKNAGKEAGRIMKEAEKRIAEQDAVRKEEAAETVSEAVPDLTGLPEDQRTVLSVFTAGTSLSADRIAQLTGQKVSEVLAALTMLEISGKVTALPGGMYTADFKK